MRVLCALALLTQQFSEDQLKHQPLTNDNIVTLAKAGFDELFILQLIRSSRTNFDTSVPALAALKHEGVSEDLIRLMAMPQLSPPAAPAASAPAEKPAKPAHKRRLLPWRRSAPGRVPAVPIAGGLLVHGKVHVDTDRLERLPA